MRLHAFVCAIGAIAIASPAVAAVKKVPYPEVKIALSEAFRADPAFQAMIAKFSAAVAAKNQAALFALVGPTFVWTLNGALIDDFDLGRDALHNFKVVFGFRPLGAAADGPVEQGPFWSALGGFATDKTFYKATNSGTLICNPMQAGIEDEDAFTKAQDKIANGDDSGDWYFTLQETPVAKAPGDRGPPIAKVGPLALPVLSTSPAAKAGEPAPPPEYLEVLLPSAKTGWIPAAAARPLAVERLCYAKTAAGEWRIVGYDQPE